MQRIRRYIIIRIRGEYLNLFNNSYIGIFRFRYSTAHVLLLNNKAIDILHTATSNTFFFNHLFFYKADYDRFLVQLHVTKKILDFEFRSSHYQDKWISITCNYYPDQDFVEGILSDVTDKKKQIEELKRLNHDLDQFIYHASHDLRSPITTMLGLVNLINLEKPTYRTLEYTGMLSERLTHLDKLLRDLVAIAYNNNTPIKPEKFIVKAEVESAIAELKDYFKNGSVEIRVNETCLFCTDIGRVRLILRNLISNAMKYHQYADSHLVVIHVYSNADRLSIEVSDNGIGIDPKYHALIFEMFFRANINFKGNGLGLYIVKAIVEKLNGTVKVSSAIGVGSRFVVELPNTNQIEQ
jgi:signal transduction histidine kinase